MENMYTQELLHIKSKIIEIQKAKDNCMKKLEEKLDNSKNGLEKCEELMKSYDTKKPEKQKTTNQMTTSLNLSDFFVDFITKINTDNYVQMLDKFIDAEYKYDIKNKCNFLNNELINNKVKEIINTSENIYIDEYKKSQNRDTSSIKQFNLIIENIDKLLILDYIINYENHMNLITEICNFTNQTYNILTFGDLRIYYNYIIKSYFDKLFDCMTLFIPTENLEHKMFKEDFNTWKIIHGSIISEDTIKKLKEIKQESVFYPYSYLTNEDTIGLRINENGQVTQNNATQTMEQSDILQINFLYLIIILKNYKQPNIVIFCSLLKKSDEIQPFIFNRFVFLHEFSHNFFKHFVDKQIKIKEKFYMMKPKEKLYTNTNGLEIFSEINKNITNEQKDFLKRNGIDDIIKTEKGVGDVVSPKNPNVFLDIAADYFAVNILVKELSELKIKDNEILKIIINIIKALADLEDTNHFDTKSRTLLNIFMNEKLDKTYDDNLQKYEPPLNKILLNLELLKKKFIDIDKDKELITAVNDVIDNLQGEQSLNYQSYMNKRLDLLIYFNTKECNKSTYDKIKRFFNDFNDYNYDNSDSLYKKKYFKYKLKYLKLKEKLFK